MLEMLYNNMWFYVTYYMSFVFNGGMILKIKFSNAKILDENYKILDGYDLVVEDNIIKKVQSHNSNDNEVYDKVIEATGKYLIPGFKNAHSHNAMVFARSLADDEDLYVWLNEKIFPLEAKLTDDDIYYFTMLGTMECLRGGITSCMDMYKNNLLLAKVYRDMGYRACLVDSITMYDKVVEPEKYFEEFNKKDDVLSYVFGIHSVYLNDEKNFKMMSDLTHKYKAPLFSHNSETKKEIIDCKEKWGGLTPTELMEKYNLFDFGGGGIHSVYLSDNDIKIFNKHNLFAITCPASNLKLASGIAPIKKYIDNDIKVAIGTDGASSNNRLDMFREMYLVSTLSKYIENDPKAIKSKSIVQMAIENGAYAMNMKNLSSLKVGNIADIIMLDLDVLNTIPQNDFINNIVYACNTSNVTLTMVNGVIKYENGEFFINEKYDYVCNKCKNLLKDLLER